MTPVIATLGVFDGFHRGHRAVTERAVVRARALDARVVAFTFDVPPRAVLRGNAGGPLLSSLGERVGLLREAGVGEVRVLRFDERLAAKDPAQFLDEHILAFHPLRAMVVGYDFAFGKNREGTVTYLTEIGGRRGFTVEPVDAVAEGGSPVSSSRIREALQAGRVDEAARCLGRPYRLPGTVSRGDGRGRDLGFPTANLAPDPARLRPGRGVYAVRVDGLGGGTLPGVANVGERPTFGGGEERVEVHLLSPAGNLLGRALGVAFVARIRDEHKFNSINELQHQIQVDVASARLLLGEDPEAPSAFA